MLPRPASLAYAHAPFVAGEYGRSKRSAHRSTRTISTDRLSSRCQDDANANGIIVYSLRQSDDDVVVVDVVCGGDAPAGISRQQIGERGHHAVSPEKSGAVVRSVEAGANDPPGVIDGADIHSQGATWYFEGSRLGIADVPDPRSGDIRFLAGYADDCSGCIDRD